MVSGPTRIRQDWYKLDHSELSVMFDEDGACLGARFEGPAGEIALTARDVHEAATALLALRDGGFTKEDVSKCHYQSLYFARQPEEFVSTETGEVVGHRLVAEWQSLTDRIAARLPSNVEA